MIHIDAQLLATQKLQRGGCSGTNLVPLRNSSQETQ